MSDAFAVAILQSCQYLLENPSSLLLIKLLVDHFFQIWVETSSSYIFHHEIYVRVGLECFDKLDDIWMVHFLEQDNFTAHTSLPINVWQFGLIINLYGIFLIVFPRSCHSHNCVCSLTNLPSEYVIMNTIGALWCSIIIISHLRRIIRWIVVNKNQIVIALTQSGVVLLLKIGVGKPLLDLVIEIFLELIDVFYTLLVANLRHLAKLLNHGGCGVVLDLNLADLLHLLLWAAPGSSRIITAFFWADSILWVYVRVSARYPRSCLVVILEVQLGCLPISYCSILGDFPCIRGSFILGGYCRIFDVGWYLGVGLRIWGSSCQSCILVFLFVDIRFGLFLKVIKFFGSLFRKIFSTLLFIVLITDSWTIFVPATLILITERILSFLGFDGVLGYLWFMIGRLPGLWAGLPGPLRRLPCPSIIIAWSWTSHTRRTCGDRSSCQLCRYQTRTLWCPQYSLVAN